MNKKHPTFFFLPNGNGSHAHGLLRYADDSEVHRMLSDDIDDSLCKWTNRGNWCRLTE